MKKLIALLTLGFSVAYGQNVCTTIDPGGCRPHADESPFEGDDKQRLIIHPVAKYEFTATAVVGSTDTTQGKVPE